MGLRRFLLLFVELTLTGEDSLFSSPVFNIYQLLFLLTLLSFSLCLLFVFVTSFSVYILF